MTGEAIAALHGKRTYSIYASASPGHHMSLHCRRPRATKSDGDDEPKRPAGKIAVAHVTADRGEAAPPEEAGVR